MYIYYYYYYYYVNYLYHYYYVNYFYHFLFKVKYMPERESSLVMARKLCIERAQEIGGLTNENVVSSCIEPVVNFLQKSVQEWIDSKSLVVPIKINDKVYI